MKKILLLIGMFLCFAPHAFAAFSYKIPFTVGPAQVPSTQTNFPMDVDVTQPSLATVANGGHVTNANGYDIGFYTTSDCATTRLPAEREVYTATTGRYTGWVNVTSISNGTVIYMCYGDASVSTDPNLSGVFGAVPTWPSTYKAVFHLPDGTSLTTNDSTSFAHTLTNTGTTPATAGKIDGAALFDGATQNLSYPANTADLKITNNLTMSTWFKTTTASSMGLWVDQLQVGANVGVGFFTGTGKIQFVVMADNTTGVTPLSYNDGNWHKVDATYASGAIVVYVDGVSVKTGSVTSGTTIAYGTTQPVYISRGFAAGSFFPGTVDEPRILDTVKSADWIATEYNNQNATSTFYTLGAEVALPTAQNFKTLFTGAFKIVLTGAYKFLIN